MALFKTKQAVKYEKKHLLGIQDLSINEMTFKYPTNIEQYNHVSNVSSACCKFQAT